MTLAEREARLDAHEHDDGHPPVDCSAIAGECEQFVGSDFDTRICGDPDHDCYSEVCANCREMSHWHDDPYPMAPPPEPTRYVYPPGVKVARR